MQLVKPSHVEDYCNDIQCYFIVPHCSVGQEGQEERRKGEKGVLLNWHDCFFNYVIACRSA